MALDFICYRPGYTFQTSSDYPYQGDLETYGRTLIVLRQSQIHFGTFAKGGHLWFPQKLPGRGFDLQLKRTSRSLE